MIVGLVCGSAASARGQCPAAPSFRAPDWAADFDGRRTPNEAEARARVARLEAEVTATPQNAPSQAEQLRQLAEAQRDVYRATGARSALEASIRRFAQTVRDHPNMPHMDRVLFLLAWGLDELEQPQRAREIYFRLIRRFPTSPYVALGYLRFAEHYWAEGDFRAAQQFFQHVVAMEAGIHSAYAAYMAAWSAHRLGDASEARGSAAGARRVLTSIAHPSAQSLREALDRDACAIAP